MLVEVVEEDRCAVFFCLGRRLCYRWWRPSSFVVVVVVIVVVANDGSTSTRNQRRPRSTEKSGTSVGTRCGGCRSVVVVPLWSACCVERDPWRRSRSSRRPGQELLRRRSSAAAAIVAAASDDSTVVVHSSSRSFYQYVGKVVVGPAGRGDGDSRLEASMKAGKQSVGSKRHCSGSEKIRKKICRAFVAHNLYDYSYRSACCFSAVERDIIFFKTRFPTILEYVSKAVLLFWWRYPRHRHGG